MGWSCKNCGWTYPKHDVLGPSEHLRLYPNHEVDPDVETALKWSRAGLAEVD